MIARECQNGCKDLAAARERAIERARQRHPDCNFSARAYALVAETLNAQTSRGGSRAFLSCALGQSAEYLENTMRPSGGRALPWPIVFKLMVKEDILDEDLRRALLAAVCAEAGFALVGVDTEESGAPLAHQCLEALAAAGRLAEAVRAAGRVVDEGERARIRKCAEVVVGEVMEMMRSIGDG